MRLSLKSNLSFISSSDTSVEIFLISSKTSLLNSISKSLLAAITFISLLGSSLWPKYLTNSASKESSWLILSTLITILSPSTKSFILSCEIENVMLFGMKKEQVLF